MSQERTELNSKVANQDTFGHLAKFAILTLTFGKVAIKVAKPWPGTIFLNNIYIYIYIAVNCLRWPTGQQGCIWPPKS